MRLLKLTALLVALASLGLHGALSSAQVKDRTGESAEKRTRERIGARRAGTAAVALKEPAERESSWSFRNHVIPVLTKMGCNSGACHGAAAGKNGFRLTLRGYDPEADYAALTRQARGRRTNPSEPARSLILLKPTLAIPHGGGKRFETGSLEYRVIAGWIASGMPPPAEDDPRITRIEVLPASATLRKGQKLKLAVRAHFSDGRAEDVTRWAKFTSADSGVASVDDDGLVTMLGAGEAAISVWYLSKVTYARLSVPFPHRISPAVFERARRNNFIDELVLAKLAQLRIAPSEPSSDSQFIRRAYLDAAGILPTAEETEKFIADKSPDKRARLIDALLERSECVDYWAYKWSDVLLVSTRKLSTKSMLAFYRWIRSSVASNKPWDRFAREIITASGNTQENGAANYYVLHKDPIDITETTTQAFLGMRLTCARCHNHPLEKWTQNDYYGLANLFSRVTLKNAARPGEMTVFPTRVGDVLHPRSGKAMMPRPLDGEAIALDAAKDRREHFADWLTAPDNPYFARVLVNRVWRNFLGRGLVEEVDDVRTTNPASNEELLAALTRDFIAHNFDVKHLIRTIMNSATYQLSSATNGTNEKDDKYYSHYIVRRLPAEVLLDAVSQVTGVATPFPGYAAGTRAIELPDSRVNSYFLTVFGRPERVITAESERMADPSLPQALHAINGETINEKLRAENNTIGSFLKLRLPDTMIVDYLYLSAFSRYPSAEEKRAVMEVLAKEMKTAGDPEAQRRQIYEDLLWAILTGKEFLFNH